jgi:hypothetical protein
LRAHSEHESADSGCSSLIACSTAKKVALGDIILSHEDDREFNFFDIVGDVPTLGVQSLEVGKNLAACSTSQCAMSQRGDSGTREPGNSSEENEDEDELERKRESP